MAKTKPGSGGTIPRPQYLATATSSTTSVTDRVEALGRAGSQVIESQANFDAVLAVLRDVNEDREVRLAALRALQSATFLAITFEPYRSAYIAALRSLSKDADLELRERVLGILASNKDRPTQRKLQAGLEDPDAALVSTERALQLLSYDIRADVYPLARKVVENPPNEMAKYEALRLLAADASNAPLLEKLLRDKNEPLAIRQLCASALQAIKPKKYQTYAREMVLDDDEDADLRAQSLTALTTFGDAALAEDKELRQQAEQLKATATAKLKKSAQQFLKKHRE